MRRRRREMPSTEFLSPECVHGSAGAWLRRRNGFVSSGIRSAFAEATVGCPASCRAIIAAHPRARIKKKKRKNPYDFTDPFALNGGLMFRRVRAPCFAFPFRTGNVAVADRGAAESHPKDRGQKSDAVSNSLKISSLCNEGSRPDRFSVNGSWILPLLVRLRGRPFILCHYTPFHKILSRKKQAKLCKLCKNQGSFLCRKAQKQGDLYLL